MAHNADYVNAAKAGKGESASPAEPRLFCRLNSEGNSKSVEKEISNFTDKKPIHWNDNFTYQKSRFTCNAKDDNIPKSQPRNTTKQLHHIESESQLETMSPFLLVPILGF